MSACKSCSRHLEKNQGRKCQLSVPSAFCSSPHPIRNQADNYVHYKQHSSRVLPKRCSSVALAAPKARQFTSSTHLGGSLRKAHGFIQGAPSERVTSVLRSTRHLCCPEDPQRVCASCVYGWILVSCDFRLLRLGCHFVSGSFVSYVAQYLLRENQPSQACNVSEPQEVREAVHAKRLWQAAVGIRAALIAILVGVSLPRRSTWESSL